MTRPSIDLAIPILASQNIRATLDFYVGKLGFTERADYGEYGIVARDRVLINFWLCEDRHIAENTSAYFNVTAIDALHADLKARAPDVRMTEPTTYDYGMREFHVWDGDGNLLRFGEAVSE